MARRYGVYILGSNNQSPFRESRRPAEIETLPRPRPAARRGRSSSPPAPRSTTRCSCGARTTCAARGRASLRNVVAQQQEGAADADRGDARAHATGRAPGPDAVENLRPYRLPGTRARIAFATSLPAFVYGAARRAGVDPCSDTARYYMRCLDKLGANLVMQDEANPGRWVTDAGGEFWQPLEWMTLDLARRGRPRRSASTTTSRRTWSATSPTSPSTGRPRSPSAGCAAGGSCTYVGNSRFVPEPARERPRRARALRRAEARVPRRSRRGWCRDAPRDALRAVQAAWRPARPTGSRTTTSRPRSPPTSRSRPTAGVATASPRRSAGTSTARAARPRRASRDGRASAPRTA